MSTENNPEPITTEEKFKELLDKDLIAADQKNDVAEINRLHELYKLSLTENEPTIPLPQSVIDGMDQIAELNEPAPTEDELQEAEKKTSILSAPAITVPVIANKPAKNSNEKKRHAMTIMFTDEEWNDVVLPIANYHIAKGECENMAQFGKSVFDFAFNLGAITGKQYFGVPDNHIYKLLKNGFKDFLKAAKKILVCK